MTDSLTTYKSLDTGIHCRPVASLPTTSGRFSQILDLFQGSKVLSGYLGETSIFKTTTIDDVTLWSKLESILHCESTRFY